MAQNIICGTSMLLYSLLCAALVLQGGGVDGAVDSSIFTTKELTRRVQSSFHLIGYCSWPSLSSSPSCLSLLRLMESADDLMTHGGSSGSMIKTALLYDATYWQQQLDALHGSSSSSLWFACHDGQQLKLTELNATAVAAVTVEPVDGPHQHPKQQRQQQQRDNHHTAANTQCTKQDSNAPNPSAAAAAAGKCGSSAPWYACDSLTPDDTMHLLMAALAAAVQQQGAACIAGQMRSIHPAAVLPDLAAAPAAAPPAAASESEPFSVVADADVAQGSESIARQQQQQQSGVQSPVILFKILLLIVGFIVGLATSSSAPVKASAAAAAQSKYGWAFESSAAVVSLAAPPAIGLVIAADLPAGLSLLLVGVLALARGLVVGLGHEVFSVPFNQHSSASATAAVAAAGGGCQKLSSSVASEPVTSAADGGGSSKDTLDSTAAPAAAAAASSSSNPNVITNSSDSSISAGDAVDSSGNSSCPTAAAAAGSSGSTTAGQHTSANTAAGNSGSSTDPTANAGSIAPIAAAARSKRMPDHSGGGSSSSSKLSASDLAHLDWSDKRMLVIQLYGEWIQNKMRFTMTIYEVDSLLLHKHVGVDHLSDDMLFKLSVKLGVPPVEDPETLRSNLARVVGSRSTNNTNNSSNNSSSSSTSSTNGTNSSSKDDNDGSSSSTSNASEVAQLRRDIAQLSASVQQQHEQAAAAAKAAAAAEQAAAAAAAAARHEAATREALDRLQAQINSLECRLGANTAAADVKAGSTPDLLPTKGGTAASSSSSSSSNDVSSDGCDELAVTDLRLQALATSAAAGDSSSGGKACARDSIPGLLSGSATEDAPAAAAAQPGSSGSSDRGGAITEPLSGGNIGAADGSLSAAALTEPLALPLAATLSASTAEMVAAAAADSDTRSLKSVPLSPAGTALESLSPAAAAAGNWHHDDSSSSSDHGSDGWQQVEVDK